MPTVPSNTHPLPNFIGTDSFSYKANDGANESNIAMVTIGVLSPNDCPVAENDTESAGEDTLLSVPAPGLLANDAVHRHRASPLLLLTGRAALCPS